MLLFLFQFQSGGTATNVKVAIRCRPFTGELQDEYLTSCSKRAARVTPLIYCRKGKTRWLLMCGEGEWPPNNHQESKWF